MNEKLLNEYSNNKISHLEFFSKYVFENDDVLLESVDVDDKDEEPGSTSGSVNSTSGSVNSSSGSINSSVASDKSMSDVKYSPIKSPVGNPKSVKKLNVENVLKFLGCLLILYFVIKLIIRPS